MRRFFAFAALLSVAGPVACGRDVGGGATVDAGSAGLDDAQVRLDGSTEALVDGAAPDGSKPTPPAPAYDAVQMKASHNSYERDEPLFDQLVYHRVRAIELDIHNGKRFRPNPTNDFYVYHFDAPTFDSTSCTKLSDCVRALAAFHAAQPEHEVLTVFVDLKDDFEAGHTAADLDAVLLGLGRNAIFTPQDLLAKCPSATTLRDAVTSPCAHPSLEDLRGKMVFAMTGGTSCSVGAKLEKYVEGGAEKRVGFIAPETATDCPLSDYTSKKKHVVFLNFESAATATAGDAAKQHYLTRVYNLNDPASFARGKSVGAHFLGTNSVNAEADPWATSAQPSGYPFTCFAGCPDRQEPTDVFGIEGKGGDLVGAADGFVFAHEANVTQPTIWTSAISVASSHVDRGAKGCLMARASLDQGAPFFAVCRPADNDTVRVLRRDTASANVILAQGTYATDPPYSSESTFFARLTVTPQGAGVRVKGEGSIDGATWVTLDERTFVGPLPLQGVGVAAKADVATHALFAGLTRASGTSKERGRPRLAAVEKIGATSGKLFDRTLP